MEADHSGQSFSPKSNCKRHSPRVFFHFELMLRTEDDRKEGLLIDLGEGEGMDGGEGRSVGSSYDCCCC